MFTDKRLNIINMSFLCNLVYRLNAIAIKIPGSYFVDIDKYSKVYMERHKTQNSQDNIEGEKVRRLTLTLRLTVKLQEPTQDRTGKRINKKINGTKEKAPK